MGNYIKKKKSGTRLTDEENLMEDVLLFEEWKKVILPELRELLLRGASAKEIAKKYSSHAVARMVTIALSEKDPQKAITACKDLVDRAEGRATETKKVEHKYENLEDKQLDSLLNSELEDLEDDGNIKTIN